VALMVESGTDGNETVQTDFLGTTFYRWSAVVAFTLVYMVSYVDRQVLTIVVDPVRASLGLGDMQIGFLQGFIFTTVMIVAAVPMSYLIDRYNRIYVLIGCIVAWSLATIYCGFASSFVELALGRIGLAIAEAVVPMAAMSVIGDLFPRHKVNQAASVFMNGTYFGNGAALLLGGWFIALATPFEGRVLPVLGAFEVWRGLFIAVGLLSIAMALGLLLFLREPPRRELRPAAATEPAAESFWAFFWSNRRLLLSYCLFAGTGALNGYCLYSWTATLLIRVHGMSPLSVGLAIGPMFILTSIPATALAAWLSSFAKPENALQHVVKMMTGFMALLVPMVFLMTLGSTSMALVMVALTMLVYAAFHATILTPVQLFAPNRMRGRVAAVTSMIYVIPAGLGPVTVGFLTDYVFEDPQKLGVAMAITMGGAAMIGVLAGLNALRQARSFEEGPISQGAQARAGPEPETAR